MASNHSGSKANRRKLLLTRYGIDLEKWQKICQFYGNRCLSCHKPIDYLNLSVDHVNPAKKRLRNHPSNYQPLCFECNRNKAQKNIDFRFDKGKELLRYLSGFNTLHVQESFLGELEFNKGSKPDDAIQLVFSSDDFLGSPSYPKDPDFNKLWNEAIDTLLEFSRAVKDDDYTPEIYDFVSEKVCNEMSRLKTFYPDFVHQLEVWGYSRGTLDN